MQFQDEYVEWRAETQNGVLRKVTFTTEFSEYLQALAEVGVAPLKAEIAKLVPGANPTDADLFGAAFNPQTSRRDRTRQDDSSRISRTIPGTTASAESCA